jgi:TonB family protein
MTALLTLFLGLLVSLTPAYAYESTTSQIKAPGTDVFAQAATRTRSRIDREAVKFNNQIIKPNNKQQAYVREKWAFIVGISQFKDSQIQPIKVATNNALLLGWALKDPSIGRFAPSHVASQLNGAATKEAVENAILNSDLIRKALPDDLIILYFSTRLLSPTKEDDITLCAYDTSLSHGDSSGIKLSELLSNLQKRTRCQQILCILDCPPTSAAAGISLQPLAEKAGVNILSASQPGADSRIDRKGTFSCFSRYLVTGLKDTSGTGTLQYLINYIQDTLNQDNLSSDGKTTAAPTQQLGFATSSQESKMPEIIIGAPPLGAWYTAEISNRIIAASAIKPPASPIEALEAKANADSQPKADRKKDGSVDFGPWMSKMKKDIKNKWNCPKGHEHDHTAVVFSIMHDGSIFNPFVEESSGVPAVDQSTLEAVKAASPLAPLPEGAPEFVRVRYVFDWRVSHKY